MAKAAWMPLTLTEMAVDIRQILSSLGISQVIFVASSMGGLVALELYRMIPEDIMRMSLVGSIPNLPAGTNYPAGLDIDKIRTLSQSIRRGLCLDPGYFFPFFIYHERTPKRSF